MSTWPVVGTVVGTDNLTRRIVWCRPMRFFDVTGFRDSQKIAVSVVPLLQLRRGLIPLLQLRTQHGTVGY
jgi:hypothetical protein